MALKAVLFDMDGVLFNSMPYHAVAWAKAMSLNGLPFEEREAYLHEGRTGAGTINIVKQRIYGTDATPEEIKKIYQDKCDVFNSFPLAKPLTEDSNWYRRLRQRDSHLSSSQARDRNRCSAVLKRTTPASSIANLWSPPST
jgi:beta-phosphoglucomutase-like phosphatase (HAD superfamily)